MTKFKTIVETIATPTSVNADKSEFKVDTFSGLTELLNEGYEIVTLNTVAFQINDQTKLNQLSIVAVLKKTDG